MILALGGSNHATNPYATVGGAYVQPYTAAAGPVGSSCRSNHARAPACIHAGRSPWLTQASVLSPLTPQERHYVLGIMSLSPAQLWAPYGAVK